MTEVLDAAMLITTTLWSFKVSYTTKKHAVGNSKTPFKCLLAWPIKKAAKFLSYVKKPLLSEMCLPLAKNKPEKVLLSRSHA